MNTILGKGKLILFIEISNYYYSMLLGHKMMVLGGTKYHLLILFKEISNYYYYYSMLLGHKMMVLGGGGDKVSFHLQKSVPKFKKRFVLLKITALTDNILK